jgi:hypothetical protein
VTDAPPRQTDADENHPENEVGHAIADAQPGSGSAPGAGPGSGPEASSGADWAADQPPGAPWYLGRPGPVQPAAPPWARPPAPAQGAGQSPPPGQGSAGGSDRPPQDAVPPPWSGTAPPNPPPTGDGGQQPAPWHDPNRYSNPGGRPPRQQQRPPQPGPRGPEGLKRPVLDLRTRWARGLAVGSAACTLVTLLYTYSKFPAYLVGAATGLAMALAGLWLGTIAHRAASRAGRKAPEAMAAIVWSAISCVISVSIVAFSLAFYSQLEQYSTCVKGANTIAAQHACQTQLENTFGINTQ